MKVGDSFEAEAYILPKSAEDPTQIVNFTSSNNSVLYVRKLTNTTAKVTALKAGTAITACDAGRDDIHCGSDHFHHGLTSFV